jgi:malate permease and related proteins
MITILLEVLLPIAVVASVGYLLRKNLVLDIGTFNRVMIYGLTPTLIFVSLVRTDLMSGASLRMMLLSFLVVVSMAVLTMIIAWPLGIRGADLSAVLLVALFMNTGNYGLPAARFAFGEEGFNQALLYFIVQSAISQTGGVVVAAAGNASGGQTNIWAEVIGRLFRMPQIYAVVAALVVRFSGFDLPNSTGLIGGLWDGIALLSEAALPVMLLILGMQLATGVVIDEPRMVALGTVLRLLISPLLAFGIGQALGLDGMPLAVGVMLAGMPAAVNTTILAIEFNTRPSVVVGTVITTSLGSLGTLSLLLWLLQ